MPLEDYGALIRSGGAIVPDYVEQQQKNQLLGIQQQNANAQGLTARTQAMAEQAKLQRQQQFQAAFANLSKNPSATGWSQLMGAFPEFSEGLKRGHDALDESRKTADTNQMSRIYYALDNGRADLATQVLEARINADKASGQDTSDDEALLEQIKSGDPSKITGAKTIIGGVLQTITGKDVLPKAEVHDGIVTTANSAGNVSVQGQLPTTDVKVGAFGAVRVNAPGLPILGGAGPSIIGGSSVPQQQEGGGPVSGGAGGSGGSGTPRSIRNNNGGNIKDGPFARSQPGYAGKDKDGFAIFKDPQSGVAAGQKLLANYIRSGHNTIDKIVSRWTSGDNPQVQANYKQYVANKLGVTISQPVTAAQIRQIFAAKSEFESGQRPLPTRPSGKVEATQNIGGRSFVKIGGKWFERG